MYPQPPAKGANILRTTKNSKIPTMAFRLVIFTATMAVASTAPFTIVGNNLYPNTFETPKIAVSSGHGFASDVFGVKYANSIGTSFSTGDAEAYGAGYASNDGTSNAGGLGSAITRGNNVIYYPSQTTYPTQSTYRNPTYLTSNQSPTNSVAYAQNTGGNGAAYALSQNIPNYRATVPSGEYSISHASNLGGNNIATAQSFGGSGTSVANAYNFRNQGISNAYSTGNGGYSGATSFNTPGQQIAQAYNFNQ